jgi:hypothetical protein
VKKRSNEDVVKFTLRVNLKRNSARDGSGILFCFCHDAASTALVAMGDRPSFLFDEKNND